MDDIIIDGKVGLQAQEDTLNTQEELRFVEITDYRKDTGPNIQNRAPVVAVNDVPSELKLFSLSGTNTVAVIIAAHPGCSVVFQREIYVSGGPVQVLGVRVS